MNYIIEVPTASRLDIKEQSQTPNFLISIQPFINGQSHQDLTDLFSNIYLFFYIYTNCIHTVQSNAFYRGCAYYLHYFIYALRAVMILILADPSILT